MKSIFLTLALFALVPAASADELIATCKLETGKSLTLSWNTAANALKLDVVKKNKPSLVIFSKIPALSWTDDGLVEKRYFFEANNVRYQFVATKDSSRARVPYLITQSSNGEWTSHDACTKSDVNADFQRPAEMPLPLESVDAFTERYGKDWELP